MQKRTYSIEENTLRAFERMVASGSRSEVITDLLRNYLAEKEREEIRAAIIAGAPLVNDLYLEESKLWYPLEEEVYAKSINKQVAPRRRRASGARSHSRA